VFHKLLLSLFDCPPVFIQLLSIKESKKKNGKSSLYWYDWIGIVQTDINLADNKIALTNSISLCCCRCTFRYEQWEFSKRNHHGNQGLRLWCRGLCQWSEKCESKSEDSTELWRHRWITMEHRGSIFQVISHNLLKSG